jgi:hypothetical protein
VDFKQFKHDLEAWFVSTYNTLRFNIQVLQIGPQRAEVIILRTGSAIEFTTPLQFDLTQAGVLDRAAREIRSRFTLARDGVTH